MTITEIAVKRSTLVVVVFTTLTLLGLLCYTNINYALIPKMDAPMVMIVTQYPGASADEVENSVTRVLEDAISGLEKMKYMSSTSQEGASSITVEFKSGADVNVAIEDAQRKVNAALYRLPTGAETPSLQSFSSDQMPVLKLGVSANIVPTKLHQIVKDQIKPRLSKIDGVGGVSLVGGDEREIRVNVNRDRMKAYGLGISQIFAAVENSNKQFAAGSIKGDRSQFTIRLSGKVTSLGVLKNVTVATTESGGAIRLSDVAEVVDGIAEYDNISRINGKNSIGIEIQKRSDANSVEVCRLARQEMVELTKEYASIGVTFTIASDNSEFTLESANSVLEDLGLAIILVAIVMLLFLHSLRNSLIVLVSIPTSLVSVFIGMYIFDFTLNMMTLTGLALVIGILVDDSIVVLENIYRHLTMGKDKVKASLDGREEIGFTALAITMVDVVVFLPMSLVSGMIGGILREFTLVIVFSTLMSLLVSFTVTPLLASRFSRLTPLTCHSLMGRIGLAFERQYSGLLESYEGILRWGLAHRWLIYALVFVLILSSMALLGLGFIGSEFMPNTDRGEFVVKLEGEPQNTLHRTNQLTEKVERLLLSKPEVIRVFASIGYSSGDMGMRGGSEQHKSEITVALVDKKKRKQSVEQYAASIKNEILTAIPGLKVTSTPSSTMGTSEAPVQILLRGSDMSEIYGVADSVMKVIKEIPGINDINLSIEKNKPEMHIDLNRDRMSLLGLTVSDVGNTLQYAFSGNTDLKYSETGTDYDINVMLDAFDRKSADDIGSISFVNSKGQVVELRQFADIYQSLGPNKLERYNRVSSLTVKAEVYGRPVGTVGEEVQRAITEKVRLNGVTIDYKGQMERQSEAFSSLFFALLAAILLVYFVMVSLYNSYLYPFVVLFSLPVAVIGALLALALSGENLSMYSLIGIVMLMGLVAKNAILLVDFANKLRTEGLSLTEALVEAGKERMRPILMTTVAMVFGMIPLAISTGASSESKNGLAWVIIGGLTSSLLLTLILVPSAYLTLENVRANLVRGFRGRESSTVAVPQ
jgi:hydrophobic/amphiphilic exporter-1 (mainly G- bacteria), HAE1 family